MHYMLKVLYNVMYERAAQLITGIVCEYRCIVVLWGDQKSQKNVQTRCTWEHEGPENYFWSYGLKMIQVLAYKLEQENITTSWFPD